MIDAEICEGHARCVQAASEVFELDEGDRAVVRDVALSDDVLALVRDAVLRCPVQAITLIPD